MEDEHVIIIVLRHCGAVWCSASVVQWDQYFDGSLGSLIQLLYQMLGSLHIRGATVDMILSKNGNSNPNITRRSHPASCLTLKLTILRAGWLDGS